MFSGSDLEYRAGITINVDGQAYSYSLAYFMKSFVEYTEKVRAEEVQSREIIDNNIFKLVGSGDYFDMSQAIVPGSGKLTSKFSTPDQRVNTSELLAFWGMGEKISQRKALADQEDIKNSYLFYISEREIKMMTDEDSDRYVYDKHLVEKNSDILKKDRISYRDMAVLMRKFSENTIENYFQEHKITSKEKQKTYRKHNFLSYDQQAAEDMLSYLFTGTRLLNGPDVFSIIVVMLFIIEPSRNPSCFLPSLMLLDLIAQRAKAPYNQPYHWANCLCNPFLVFQDDIDNAYTRSQNYFSEKISGLGEKGVSWKLSQDEKTLFNAYKKYSGGRKNFNKVNVSDFLMRHSGYFPMSHRFSFSEISAKRQEEIATLSDKKSFVIISDWLVMRNKAATLHKSEVEKKMSDKTINISPDILMQCVFPFFYREIDDVISHNKKFTFDSHKPEEKKESSKPFGIGIR